MGRDRPDLPRALAGSEQGAAAAFLLASGVYAPQTDEDGSSISALSLSDFDTNGSTRVVIGMGIKITLHLGELAKLREMASQGL